MYRTNVLKVPRLAQLGGQPEVGSNNTRRSDVISHSQMYYSISDLLFLVNSYLKHVYVECRYASNKSSDHTNALIHIWFQFQCIPNMTY